MRWLTVCGTGLALSVAVSVSTGCAGDDDQAYGTSDCRPNPTSDRVAVGQQSEVTVSVTDQRLGDLDFAGRFWSSDDDVPLSDGEYEATAVMSTNESSSTDGTVAVELVESGISLTFTGPIYCA
jgi:hypothetical protein